jgi:hypothetical protein
MTICVMIGFRFHYRPGSFISTFTDQVESLFIPATVSPESFPPHIGDHG